MQTRIADDARRGSGRAVPRIVVGGTHSGVGKTSVATALMAAFTARGLKVQAFKVGPDFIDPGFHQAATGRPSHNLDGWMLSRAANEDIFARASQDADLVVIEGVMGLFDGHSGTHEAGSTAEMAKWLEAPVVLVMDAEAMARSAAAMVHGYATFDPRLQLRGVIFNRVNGAGHYQYLREAVQSKGEAEALGYLPSEHAVRLPERHLGLQLAQEVAISAYLEALGRWIAATVDLDRVLAMASATARVPASALLDPSRVPVQTRIGVARDRAFCFYYEENLNWLRRNGAELVEFSPMADSQLPADVDGLYFGGGYPELHAGKLSSNAPMRQAVGDFAAAGGPVYAECGGLMYLTDSIIDVSPREFAMVGIFPTRARMQSKPAALGYVEVEIKSDRLWLRSGENLRGHQFRYSTIDPMPESIERAYRGGADGYVSDNVLGSYVHLHFGSCPNFARRFVQCCASHAQKRLNPTL